MSGKSDLIESHGGYVNRAAKAFAEHNGGRLPAGDKAVVDQLGYQKITDALIASGETPLPDMIGKRFDTASVIPDVTDDLHGVTRNKVAKILENELRDQKFLAGGLGMRSRTDSGNNIDDNPLLVAKIRAETAMGVLDQARRIAKETLVTPREATLRALQTDMLNPYPTSMVTSDERSRQALALAADVYRAQQIISELRQSDNRNNPVGDFNGELSSSVMSVSGQNEIIRIPRNTGLFKSVVDDLLASIKPGVGVETNDKNVMHFKQNAMTLAAALEYVSKPAASPESLVDAAMEKAGQQMAMALNSVTQNAGNMFRTSSALLGQIAAGALKTTVTETAVNEREFALRKDQAGLKSERVTRKVVTEDNFPAGAKVSAGTVKANISTSPVTMHTSRIAAVPLVDDYGVMGHPDVHADASGVEASVSGGSGAIFSEITFVSTGSAHTQIEITGPTISR